MMKYKIRLDTLADINKFITITNAIPAPVFLIDENNTCKVSAKSLIAAIYTMEWNNIYCISDFENLYSRIQDFIVNE